jgi:hypothetical protein
MSLTCRTLFLIFHAMYMHKNRVMLRWWFIMPLGVPRSFTCRSIGLESWWDLGSFCVIGRGARVHRDRWMHFLLHGWGVGNRWCQPCPSLVIPHVWVGCRILNCHIKLLTDQYLVASRLISCLALALVHVHVWSSPILCMAILEQACSTWEYFLFFVSLLSLRLAQVCVHYPENTMFTPVINFGPLFKHVILFISIL